MPRPAIAVAAKNQPEVVSKPILDARPVIIKTKPKNKGNLANLNKRKKGSKARIIEYPLFVEPIIRQRSLDLLIG